MDTADYFSVALFRGQGAYDRGACDSLPAAMAMAARMEEAANNGRKALIYVVSANGRAELVIENTANASKRRSAGR